MCHVINSITPTCIRYYLLVHTHVAIMYMYHVFTNYILTIQIALFSHCDLLNPDTYHTQYKLVHTHVAIMYSCSYQINTSPVR